MDESKNLMKPIEGDNTYYPTKQMLEQFTNLFPRKNRGRAIVPGMIARTDGFDVDEMVDSLEDKINKLEKGSEERINIETLLSRMLSVSDITEELYLRFCENKNSMYNWINEVEYAIENTDTELISPETKVWRLPIELAQFIRIEYQDVLVKDKNLFNKIVFNMFGLEDEKTYFIKTGVFSSKFQYANAKCSEPREMGEYFQVINNFAMNVGAGNTVDLVVREYIEDIEGNPTIYNGMPLRTEFRAFVDCDKNEIIGVVPYWNPLVMKRALSAGLSDSMEKDYQTYLEHEHKLMDEYNKYLPRVRSAINQMLPELKLEGQYSVDVMKNGNDLYVIDLALMSESALTELL